METHWPHLDFIENQDGHHNCRQNNVYSANDLYLCIMCIVYSSFYCWLIRGHDTVWTLNGADIIEGFEKLKMTTTMAASMSFILKMTYMYKVMYVVFYDSSRKLNNKCENYIILIF